MLHQPAAWFSDPVYMTTIYFVDPSIICSGGRAREEFDSQVVITSENYHQLINSREQETDSCSSLDQTPHLTIFWRCLSPRLRLWKILYGLIICVFLAWETISICLTTCQIKTVKKCCLWRWSMILPADETKCISQLLYDEGRDGRLNGFAWQHWAMLDGDSWEIVPKEVVPLVLDTPPECVTQLIESPGLSSLHHYFLENPLTLECN